MNIVLLEDDADAGEAMAALLSLDAHEVLLSHDGPSFQQATRDLRGEAVIFDLQLRDGAGGLQLAMDYQQRRHAAGLAPAKLIALSGSTDPAAAIAAASLPFPVHHHFTKPADHDAILAALLSD
jgi:two-component system CheB/CheR fusion protein